MNMNIHKAESFKDFEEKFKFLFDNVADPIFILDNKGKFIQINKKVKEILGYKKKDLIGKKFIEMNILTKKSKLIALKNFIKRMADFEIKPYEIEIIKKNGDIIIGEINASAMKENGKTIGDMVICRDVTEKRKIEQKLIESEQKYRLIFEEASDGILVADVKTRKFIFANPKVCEIVGYPLKELLKLDVTRIHPKKDLPYVLDQFRKQTEGKIGIAKDIPVLRKDKKIVFCDVNSKNIDIKGQKCVVGFFRDITKRKKVEEDIKKNENKYRTLVENLPQKIFLKDKNSVYISCNENYARDLKIKPNKIIGKTDYDFYPKKLAEKYRKDDKRIMKSEKIEDIEEEYIQDGKKLFVHTIKVPIKDEKENVAGLLGIFWDITDKKKVEEAIKISEGKFRALMNNIPSVVMNVNQNGKIMFINYTLPGFTMKKTIGKTIYDFIPPEYHGKVKETIKQVFKTGKVSVYEAVGAGSEGEMRYYSTVVGPIKQEKKVVSVILISSDITEKKKTEEELRTEKTKLESYIEGMNDGVVILTLKGEVINVNKAYSRMFGREKSEVIGKSVFSVGDLPKKEFLGALSILKGIIQKGSVENRELTLLNKEKKEVPILFSATLIKDNRGKPESIFTTFKDITERKKVEEELRKNKEKLQLKVEELEKFNKLIIGRELKMVELKRRIEELEYELGEKKKIS